MTDVSFLEKLKVLVDVSSSSGLCIASIFILIFLAFIIITTNKKNAKTTKVFYGIIYTLLIVIILIQYGSSLSSMFDYMMNNFFIIVYFPNLAIYLAAIIATNIILWKSVFSIKKDKLLKIINTIIYCIMNYLMVLILNIITSNKLNVFDQSSVYSDKKALALIGLSSTIFIVWIIFIIIYKIIRSRQKAPNIMDNVIMKTESVRIGNSFNNITKVPVPIMVKGTINKKTTAKEVKQTNLVDFYKDEEKIKQYNNMLTLNDYKLVLELLKNNKNSITINNIKQKIKSDSNVNKKKKVIISRVERSYDDVEQPKLDQLLNLYKSV